jgi:hypothetical protein
MRAAAILEALTRSLNSWMELPPPHDEALERSELALPMVSHPENPNTTLKSASYERLH